MFTVTREEAGQILINAKDVKILAGLSESYPQVIVNGYKFTFFNDAGDLDYVEAVIAPDGRKANYRDFELEDGYPKNPGDYIDLGVFQEKFLY